MFEMGGYKVLNHGGEDVTNSFFSDTMSAYQAGNLLAIVNYMFENKLSAVSTAQISDTTSNARSRYKTVEYYMSGVEFVDELNHGIENHNYIIWELFSDITYDSNEGIITHATTPVITIDFFMHYGDDPGWYELDYATKTIHETSVDYAFGGDAGMHVVDVGDIGVVNLTYRYRFDYETTYYLPT